MIIFRKNALQKISSAEELDKSIFIVNSVSWLVLLAIVAIAVIFISWATVSTIKTEVKAQGIFLPHNGIIADIVASRGGKLKKIKFNVGDYVREDDIVAELSSDKLQEEYTIAKRRIATEQEFYNKVSGQIHNEKALRNKKNKIQIAYIDENIENIKKEVQVSEKIYAENQEFYKQHLITETKLSNLFISLSQIKSRLNNLVISKNDIFTQDNKINHQESLRLINISKNINTYSYKIELLELELQGLYIKSPENGLITEIKVINNTDIRAGEPIMSVVTGGRYDTEYDSENQSSSFIDFNKEREKTLKYLAYVDIANGKKVKRDTKVNIEVSYLSKNSYGMVKGLVKSISEFPLSSAAIKAKLSNENLVSLFTQRGPVYEVSVELLYDENFRLEWTSAKGYEVDGIDVGSLGFTSFIIKEVRPITLAIPWLKSVFD